MHKIICPYCFKPARKTKGTAVYKYNYGDIYLCKPCNAYVGTNKATGEPLGTLADAELREWRKKAHSVFDQIWKRKFLSRKAAYNWLCYVMGTDKDKTHIAMFDVEQCKKVVEESQKYIEERIPNG